MEIKAILLWSAGLALVAIVVSGYYLTESVYGSTSFGTDEINLEGVLESAINNLGETDGGMLEFKGATASSGELILVKVLSNSFDNTDYRFEELNPRNILLSDENNMRFVCSTPLATCSKDYIAVEKNGRVDGRVTCAPAGKLMSCTVEITPSSSEAYIAPAYKGKKLAIQQDTEEIIQTFQNDFKEKERRKTPVLGIYTGAPQELVTGVIVNVAELGIFLNLAGTGDFDLSLAANEKYGIPFFDGTRSLEEHAKFLKANVKSPSPLEANATFPTLKQLIAEDEKKRANAGLGFALTTTRITEFDRTMSALLYIQVTAPIYWLNQQLNLLGNNEGPSWEKKEYDLSSQGTLSDQAQRLEILYLLQNKAQKIREQRIANAILWLEKHPEIDKVSVFEDDFKKGDVVSSLKVSEKSGKKQITFELAKNDLEIYSEALKVTESKVVANQNRRAWWTVKKVKHEEYGELKNSYKVILSRQRNGGENE